MHRRGTAPFYLRLASFDLAQGVTAMATAMVMVVYHPIFLVTGVFIGLA